MCFNTSRCVASAIVSILIGVVVGIVFFNALLPGVAAAIIIALIFAAMSLLLISILGTLAKGKEKKCVCKAGMCALVGAIITIILGIVASSITIATAVVGTAILIGVLGAALFFTVFSIAEVIACVLECRCDYE